MRILAKKKVGFRPNLSVRIPNTSPPAIVIYIYIHFRFYLLGFIVIDYKSYYELDGRKENYIDITQKKNDTDLGIFLMLTGSIN